MPPKSATFRQAGFLEIDFLRVIFVLLDYFNGVVRLVFHSK